MSSETLTSLMMKGAVVSAKYYTFEVGEIACTVLLDGAETIGQSRFLRRYPDATEQDYRKAFAEMGLSFDDADSSFNILLAQIGGETVLIDAGEGGKPAGGDLPVYMEKAGFSREDVTLIVITHAHGDHIMGLLTDDHHPVFPNARYVLSHEEHAYWQTQLASGEVDNGAILRMMQTQGLRLIDMDEIIMEGLTAIPIPGHTLGQIALLVESAGERMLHMVDVLHSPMQFAHPEWSAKFDANTRVSVPTRLKALNYASDEGVLTLFYHLTFPGLGYVEKRATAGYRWIPHTHRNF